MKLNTIKKSFDQRSITPSADSWDNLSQRLDSEQKTSKRPYLYWITAVAAALLAAFLLYPVINGDATDVNKEIVKEEPTPLNSTIKENNLPSDALTKEELITKQDARAVSTTTLVTNNTEEQSQKPAAHTGSKTHDKADNNDEAVAQTTAAQANSDAHVQVAMQTPSHNPVLHNTAAVVQQTVKDQKPGITKLTAAQEADLLLQRAMATLKTQPTGVASKSIDPKKLLMETQWDIDAEKRNRLENMLLDQFGKLKTQVVTLVDKK